MGTIYEGPTYTTVVLKKGVSDQFIWTCTANHGTGSARAICALDSVRWSCNAQPLPGFYPWICAGATEHRLWFEMLGAFQEVFQNGGCLAVSINPSNWTYNWYGNHPGGCG